MLWTKGLDLAPFKPEGDPKAERRGEPALAGEHSIHTVSFPYFLRHWKKEDDPSSLCVFTSCFYVQNRKPPPPCTHSLLSLLMNHFTHLSNISPSTTFSPHQLTLTTGKAQSWLAISWDRLSQEFPASGSARHTATTDALAVFWHLHSLFRPRPRNASEKKTPTF